MTTVDHTDTVDLREYIANGRKARAAERDAIRDRIKDLGESLESGSVAIEELKSKIAKEQQFCAEAEERRVDTTNSRTEIAAMEATLQDLRDTRANDNSELDDAKTRQKELPEQDEVDTLWTDHAEDWLANHADIQRAYRVERIEDVIRHKEIGHWITVVAESDEDGRVTRVRIRAAAGSDNGRYASGVACVLASTNDRVLKAWRPKVCEMMSRRANDRKTECLLDSPVSAECDAFYVNATGQIVLADAKRGSAYDAARNKKSSRFGHEGTECVNAAFERYLPSLESLLRNTLSDEVKSLGGQLDLDRDLPDSPLLELVRLRLLEATTTEPLYPVTNLRLNTTDTFKKIEPDIKALMRAPWHSGLDRTISKLKYLLENGEQARFWCEEHANHYGFRLRTRDHSWIWGYILIEQASEPMTDQVGIEIVEASSNTIRVGRMLLQAHEVREHIPDSKHVSLPW
jgi:hypothetical protein